MNETRIERKCVCGGEMFIDSFQHPKRTIEWLWRCMACGNTEDSTQDEAMIAYGDLIRTKTRDAGIP